MEDIMTQKELLYMEDAISHEKIMIDILNDMITKCNDKIANYFQKEIEKHQNLKSELMEKLKEKANG